MLSRLLPCLVITAALTATACRQPARQAETTNRTDTTAVTGTAAEPRPELLSRVEPDYPQAARDTDAQGLVEVEVTVDTTGAVVAAEVIESSGNADLDEAAAKAALKARFRPAMKDGVPVESRTVLPFGFWLGS